MTMKFCTMLGYMFFALAVIIVVVQNHFSASPPTDISIFKTMGIFALSALFFNAARAPSSPGVP